MLGVSQAIVHQIAKMPVEHSWIHPIMMVGEWEIDRVWEEIMNKIEAKVKMSEEASFAVSRFLPNILEAKAVWMYLEEHPSMYSTIQFITTPEEAVEMYNADRNYGLTEKEKEEVKEALYKVLEMEPPQFDLKEMLRERE